MDFIPFNLKIFILKIEVKMDRYSVFYQKFKKLVKVISSRLKD